ncbi:MAG: hypothetical protein IJ813_01100 [Bacteroidales bacterium]|nr:hypothetical protein [Bacteroidales bacterium]
MKYILNVLAFWGMVVSCTSIAGDILNTDLYIIESEAGKPFDYDGPFPGMRSLCPDAATMRLVELGGGQVNLIINYTFRATSVDNGNVVTITIYNVPYTRDSGFLCFDAIDKKGNIIFSRKNLEKPFDDIHITGTLTLNRDSNLSISGVLDEEPLILNLLSVSNQAPNVCITDNEDVIVDYASLYIMTFTNNESISCKLDFYNEGYLLNSMVISHNSQCVYKVFVDEVFWGQWCCDLDVSFEGFPSYRLHYDYLDALTDKGSVLQLQQSLTDWMLHITKTGMIEPFFYNKESYLVNLPL